MARDYFAPFRHDLGAMGLCDRAPWVEATATGRIKGARNVAQKDGTPPSNVRVVHGDS